MVEWQPILVALGSISAAVGVVVTGIYSGRIGQRRDDNQNRLDLVNARYARDQAEEVASLQRIQAIAEDAAEARKRLREAEIAFDLRFRELYTDRQRGWDLARYHFGLVSFLWYLINNLVQSGGGPDAVVATLHETAERLKTVKIPLTLEEPIPAVSASKMTT